MIDFSTVQAIIFDFGGVLIDLDKRQCINRLKQVTGYDFSPMLSDYVQSDIFMQFERGFISESVFYDEVRRISGSSASDAEIRDAWNAFLLDVPIKKKLLVYELHRHFNVFLLSNTNEIHIRQCFNAEFNSNGFLVSDYFDQCFFSNEMHLAKPDRAVFDYVLNNINIPANACLFLDDGEANIAMAKTLGFQTYLAKPGEDLWPLFESELEKKKNDRIKCRC
ncbi:MAG: HAD family hydrolase [Microbacter sp.]